MIKTRNVGGPCFCYLLLYASIVKLTGVNWLYISKLLYYFNLIDDNVDAWLEQNTLQEINKKIDAAIHGIDFF
jgi:hypothetical protein